MFFEPQGTHAAIRRLFDFLCNIQLLLLVDDHTGIGRPCAVGFFKSTNCPCPEARLAHFPHAAAPCVVQDGEDGAEDVESALA
jgi:hypothetical protein